MTCYLGVLKTHFFLIKKKKTKKNVFFGVKTKKGFIRVTQGRNNIYENFHFIISSEMKNPYAQEIHFFDKKSRKSIGQEQFLITHFFYTALMLKDLIIRLSKKDIFIMV